MPLIDKRAQEKPDARCAPAASRPKKWKDTSFSHHRSASDNPAFPARWCYGLFRARPGDRALLPPSSARCQAPCRLDISVGISGPHDFAVRIVHARQAAPRVHRIPGPTFVTIRETPLLIGPGRGGLVKVICSTTQGKFFEGKRASICCD